VEPLITAAPDPMTIDEVAEAVRRHPNTVRRWVKSGWLPAVKIGSIWYIRRSDFEQFISPGAPNDAA